MNKDYSYDYKGRTELTETSVNDNSTGTVQGWYSNNTNVTQI